MGALLVFAGDTIEPSRHSVSRTGDLPLDDRARCFEILTAEFLAPNGLWPVWENYR